MSAGFSLHPDMATALAPFEDQAYVFVESEVCEALLEVRKTLPELTPEQDAAYRAEMCAFGLAGGSGNFGLKGRGPKSPWNTFLSPSASGRAEDGTRVYMPDIVQAPKASCAYWSQRASQVANAILKARYADAVWDLQAAMGKGNPSVEIAWVAIDAYTRAVELHGGELEDLRKEGEALGGALADQLKAAARALEIAIMLQDAQTVASAKRLLMDVHATAISNRIWWWYTWDLLHSIEGANVTEAERNVLVSGMEELLTHFSDSDPEKFNSQYVVMVADRLMDHYRAPEHTKRLRGVADDALKRDEGMGVVGTIEFDEADDKHG